MAIPNFGSEVKAANAARTKRSASARKGHATRAAKSLGARIRAGTVGRKVA